MMIGLSLGLCSTTGQGGLPALAKAFADRLRGGASSLVMGILGDSPGVGTDRWVFRLAKAFGNAFADAGVRYRAFDDTNQNYPETLSFHEHPVTLGTLRLAENFGRADGAVGTVTSGGQTWAANTWLISGGKGKSDTDAASGLFSAALGQRDVILSADFVLTSGATVSVNARRANSNSVLTAAVSTTAVNLTGRFGSATTVVFGSIGPAALGLTVGVTYRLSIWAVGTSFGMSLVGPDVDASLLATLDGTQDAALTGTSCGIYSNREAVLWDNIAVNSVTESGEQPRVTMLNGSVSGSTIAYHSTRLAATLPVKPDILLISLGHNQGTMTPEAFVADYSALVASVRALYPGTAVVGVLQNPQNGTTGAAAHAARLDALKKAAPGLGYDLIDAYSAFMNDPRGLSALILGAGDNVHPNTDGSILWEQTAAARFAIAA